MIPRLIESTEEADVVVFALASMIVDLARANNVLKKRGMEHEHGVVKLEDGRTLGDNVVISDTMTRARRIMDRIEAAIQAGQFK